MTDQDRAPVDPKTWLPDTMAVLQSVLQERAEQVAKYGLQDDRPTGTGPETRWLLPFTGYSAWTVQRKLRADYEEFEEETGAPTWVHLIREEVAEAFETDDEDRLYEELVQVAALAIACCETINRRRFPPIEVHVIRIPDPHQN